jgi:uncharacterized glyoxalase superfamily protein PhnB
MYQKFSNVLEPWKCFVTAEQLQKTIFMTSLKKKNQKRTNKHFSVVLVHISFEIPGEYVILTDSLSSILAMESRKISLHTHPTVYECKQKFWELGQSGRKLTMMWIPSLRSLKLL